MKTELDNLHREIEELKAYKSRYRQLQDALREKDEWFFRVFHESANPMSILSSPELRFIDVNEAYVRLSGFQREELINHSADEISLLADPARKDRIAQILREPGTAPPLELNVFTKRQELLTILFAAIPTKIGDEQCLLATFINITEKKRETDALRKSEEKYRMLVEYSLQGLLIIQDMRCVFCNSAYAEMVGYSIPELLALGDFDVLVHPDDRQRIREHYGDLLAGKPVSARNEYRLIRKNGEDRWVEAYDCRIEFNGKPAAQLAHIDITKRKRAEASARESKERLWLALQGIRTFNWEWNLQTGEIVDEAEWLRELGYQPGEIESNAKSWLERIHPDDLVPMRSAFQAHAEGNTPFYEVECRCRSKSGQWVWFLDKGKIIERDSSGNPLRVAGIHMGISERKQAMEQIRQLVNEQNTILNTISAGICYVKNRKVQWVNPAFADMFGYALDALQGMATSEFYLHPEDYQRIAEDGYPRLAKGGSYFTEALMKKKNGSLLWCSIAGQAVREDPGQGAIWVLTDITERRRTEEALRASEERFKRLVQNSNDMIIIVDEMGARKSIIGPAEKILGYDPEELLRTNAFEQIHPEDAANVKKGFENITKRPGNKGRIEYRYRHKDGHWVPVETVGSNLLDDPVVSGIVLNVRDISERKKLQEQLQQAIKMEAVGVLAGGVAHDFNNLLNVINGYCELLLDDLEVRDKKREEIELILQAGQRAASLTSQLLAFSRKQILQPVVLNLNDSITEMSAILRRLIGEDIKLASITQPGLGSIHADPGQIQQIIMNLAVNARDAMPQGGQLTIETANVDLDEEYFRRHPAGSPGPYVMLAISDNGIGMSTAVQERLFEPFFTTKEKGKGTGLGLSTVYGIVKQSNGLIWVYSELGKGTTFKIYFPRLESKMVAAAVEKAPKSRFRGSETILAVEDEASVRTLAARILRDHGYTVLTAASGEEALAMARANAGKINLVLTDVVMPGMSGKELVSQLSAILPRLKALFVSGYTTDAIVHHGILDSGVSFLQKPFSVEGLARKIREVLDQ